MEWVAGIRAHLTATPGIGGRLKAFPEDFVVQEIPGELEPAEEGRYTVATVTARNWESNRLVREMARRLGVSRKRIRFAGTKDKRAVTTRLIQFDVPLERVASLELPDVRIEDAFLTNRKLHMGDLRGNRFRVTVRDLSLPPHEALEALRATKEALEAARGFPNFFGVQRFGEVRPVTHLVGRAIVAGDLKAAVDAYLAAPMAGEPEDAFEARKALQESGDYAEALVNFPDRLGFEKAILNALVRHPDDYVGALEALPLNLQLMFVHAYQGYLFNRVLSERMERGLPLSEAVVGDVVLPLDPWGAPLKRREIPADAGNLEKVNRQVRSGAAAVSGPILGSEMTSPTGEPAALEEAVFEEEDIGPRDFIIPEMPRLSSKGMRRGLLARVFDLEIHVDEDGATLTFHLPRGTYATCLLREFMKL
jgi:tRNA pseudouridine13 synthase